MSCEWTGGTETSQQLLSDNSGYATTVNLNVNIKYYKLYNTMNIDVFKPTISTI